MKKYLCEVPLKYFNTVNINSIDYKYTYTIEIEPVKLYSYNVKLSKGTFEAEEVLEINLLNKSGEMCLYFDAIYADNEQYALEMLLDHLDKILPPLTYHFNTHNKNKHSTQYKIIYDINKVKIKEEDYIIYDHFINKDENRVLMTKMKIVDSVRMEAIHTIKLSGYESILTKSLANPLLSQLIKCYSRAMGDTDEVSKYFNLFIIIEALEIHYKEIVGEKLVSNEDVENFIKYLDTKENEEISFISNNGVIKNRIKDLLRSITKDPRGEKLLKILNEILEIRQIQVLDKIVYIDKEFVARIIKHRNQLFHAKVLKKDEQSKLREIIVQLFILSELIIKKLIDEKSNSLIIKY